MKDKNMADETKKTVDGKYTLLGRRETGKGFSCYLAHHHRLGAQVLVDLLDPVGLFSHPAMARSGAADILPGLLDRLVFMRHPSLAGVLAWGLEGEELFVVWEFNHGLYLSDLLERTGGLPVPQALEIMRAVVKVMGFLQGKGVYFLGINPHQIHIDRRGKARLVRPGYAWMLEEADPLLSRSVSPYLAPEVLKGEEGSRLSDVYSLGVLASQLLPSLREDPAVGRVLREAVSEETGRRPPSARVFLERLDEALKGERGKMPGAGYSPRGKASRGASGAAREEGRRPTGEKRCPLPLPVPADLFRRPEGEEASPSGEDEEEDRGGIWLGGGRQSAKNAPVLEELVAPLRLDLSAAAERVPHREWESWRKPALAFAACALAAAALVLGIGLRGSGRKEGAASSPAPPRQILEEADDALREPWLIIPDLRGIDAEEALRLLRGMGLEVVVAFEPSRTVPRGKVIIQEPPQGECLRPDTRVRLFVSDGPLGDGAGSGRDSYTAPERAGDGTEGSPPDGEEPGGGGASMISPVRERSCGGTAGVFKAVGEPGRSEAEVRPDGRGGPGRCSRAA